MERMSLIVLRLVQLDNLSRIHYFGKVTNNDFFGQNSGVKQWFWKNCKYTLAQHSFWNVISAQII